MIFCSLINNMQSNIVSKQEDVYQSSCAVFRMNGANERAMIEANGGGQTYLGHKRKMEEEENTGQESKKSLPPNGKKTKGRVKIKMEFIDNKLRRYTTFSKRKTGIMKKAYELSTLTGTQVMLLVASETGHVYTFATRKLQPMITSEAGKALIQTCLNSPDPPGGNGSTAPDQRMSATGFEETDLTYSVTDETDNKMSHLPNLNQIPEYTTQKLPPFYMI
ncbi:serum response factor homolog [Centruroides sculpturatus]|uniref:serum response factor homolog n=1 Tax=Centruroides sculpturatus TaxID=218467 RepID=UPI000C6DD3E8|nr:serum response factor homolog [Centruroides sculpturatus]